MAIDIAGTLALHEYDQNQAKIAAAELAMASMASVAGAGAPRGTPDVQWETVETL